MLEIADCQDMRIDDYGLHLGRELFTFYGRDCKTLKEQRNDIMENLPLVIKVAFAIIIFACFDQGVEMILIFILPGNIGIDFSKYTDKDKYIDKDGLEKVKVDEEDMDSILEQIYQRNNLIKIIRLIALCLMISIIIVKPEPFVFYVLAVIGLIGLLDRYFNVYGIGK